eukprot:6886929-Prorocentrum_lima.AAC.1
MTSSLVGSEMCIRDRYSGVEMWNICKQRRMRILHPDGGHLSCTGTAEPVSYTHLTLPTICSV